WVPNQERLFQNLYGSLKPGGWLVAQCGGGPNLSRLLERMAVLLQRPRFAPYLADYKHSWVYSDAETAAQRLRSAGFVEVDTSLEQAPTRLEDDQRYREDRKSTRLNSSHVAISYAVFCLKKKKQNT